MAWILLCTAEILPAEQRSYFWAIQYEYLWDYLIYWLTLMTHSMQYVVIAFVDENVTVIVVVVEFVYVDSAVMLEHLVWAMVMDMVVLVGLVVVLPI